MEAEEISRSRMIRNGIVFQIKLSIDALRDILFSPISIFCLVLDLLFPQSPQEQYFSRLMRFGEKTDRWLNLFSPISVNPKAASNAVHNTEHQVQPTHQNADELINHLEQLIKQQHTSGAMTIVAKRKLDEYIARVRDKATPSKQ